MTGLLITTATTQFYIISQVTTVWVNGLHVVMSAGQCGLIRGENSQYICNDFAGTVNTAVILMHFLFGN